MGLPACGSSSRTSSSGSGAAASNPSTAATAGYTPFTGAGSAAAWLINSNGTGEVFFLRGGDLVHISLRKAPDGTIQPTTAPALAQLAQTVSTLM